MLTSAFEATSLAETRSESKANQACRVSQPPMEKNSMAVQFDVPRNKGGVWRTELGHLELEVGVNLNQ